jgi:hypothetical protein
MSNCVVRSCGSSCGVVNRLPSPLNMLLSRHTRRREFITLLGEVVAWPFTARAQPAKLPSVGLLGSGTLSAWSGWTAAFVQRLRELGWIEGRTIGIEYRWAEGRSERFTEIGAEFVRLKVDVIVTLGAAVPALKQLTSADSHRLCGSFGPCRIRFGRVTGAARRQCHRPVDAIDRAREQTM